MLDHDGLPAGWNVGSKLKIDLVDARHAGRQAGEQNRRRLSARRHPDRLRDLVEGSPAPAVATRISGNRLRSYFAQASGVEDEIPSLLDRIAFAHQPVVDVERDGLSATAQRARE